jgi:chromosomal replication initiation ATPase DnaA
MSGQLVFPFGVEPALGREDFILAPCNEQAVQFIRRWPDWPTRSAALHGPSGCGKTHLAAIWRNMAGAETVPARDLVPDLIPIIAPRGESAIVIEDIDSDEPREDRDRALLALLERPAGALLLTGRAPPSDWPVAVGDLRSRFLSLIGFRMWVPDDRLLSALVVKHFADRQLEVTDGVVKRIVTHVERTPEAVAAFVARADRKALAEKRPVTTRLVLELIDAEGESKNVL